MEVLAAIAGLVIGTSLSPEMWVAVAAVIVFSRSAKHFFFALVAAAVALAALRYALIPNYRATDLVVDRMGTAGGA